MFPAVAAFQLIWCFSPHIFSVVQENIAQTRHIMLYGVMISDCSVCAFGDAAVAVFRLFQRGLSFDQWNSITNITAAATTHEAMHASDKYIIPWRIHRLIKSPQCGRQPHMRCGAYRTLSWRGGFEELPVLKRMMEGLSHPLMVLCFVSIICKSEL